MRHACTFLLLCASAAYAVPPTLEVTPAKSNNTCEIVYLPIKTNAKKLVFVAPVAIKFTDDAKLANKNEPQMICKTPGKYTVTVIAILDNDVKREDVELVFVKGPDDPLVAPVPVVPDVPVVPVPTEKGEIFVHFVEATVDAVIIRSNLFEPGQPLRKWQEAGKHRVEACELKEPNPEYASLLAMAKEWVTRGNSLPYMTITRDVIDPKTGKVVIDPKTNKPVQEFLHHQTPPDKPGELLDILKKYGK